MSKSVHPNTSRQIRSRLLIKKLSLDSKYLGSPVFLTRNRAKDFQFVKDKVDSKLSGWRQKNLSWAGRCTLINFVAQNIPTYTMSTFELPQKVCNSIDAANRKFWWKANGQEGKYLSWKSWDRLCQPKKHGGLGFRRCKDFNLALLAKVAWKVATNHNSLCVKLLRSKYKI